MLKEFYKGSLQVFLLRISWAVIGFVGQILIARTLGVESYGQYSLIFAWLAVLCLPGRLGFDESSVKFVSKYLATEQIPRAKAFVRYATRYAIVASLLISVSGYFILTQWQLVSPSVLNAWLIALLCLPLMCLNAIRQGVLRGLKQFVYSQLPDSSVRPLIVIVLIIIASYGLGWRIDLAAVMWISFAALIVAFLLGGWWLGQLMPQNTANSSSHTSSDNWLKTSAWMAVLSSSILILSRTDILMLGAMREASELGMYSAAVRLATLFTFGLAAVNMAIAPLISKAHANGDTHGMQQLMRKAALISMGVSACLAVAMWLFGGFALSLFGEQYTQAMGVFYVLAGSHLVSAITGPTSTLMNMTGHHKRVAILFALAAVVNVFLNYLLIPSYGLMGAAVATLVSASLWKLYSIYFVMTALKLKPGLLSFTRAKAV